MGEHLEFDDIVDFIYADKLDEHTELLAQKVYSHITQCDDCRKVYMTVYELYELGFEEGMVRVEDKIKEKMTMSLSTYLLLKIKAGGKLLLDKLKCIGENKYYFSYPVELATRDSSGCIQAGDVLIDDENDYNQISFKDGKLSIRLDAEDFKGNAPELMVKLAGGEILFFGEMQSDGKYYTAEVEAPEEAELEIKFG